MEWIKSTERAPENDVPVMTKIDDERGCRNEQIMHRIAGSPRWFWNDGCYAYYNPTHWRPLTEAEKLRERSKLLAQQADQMERTEQKLSRLA